MGARTEYWTMRHTHGRLRWAILGIIVLIGLSQVAGILLRRAPLPHPGGTTAMRQVAPFDQQPAIQVTFIESFRGRWFAEEAERQIFAGYDDGRPISAQLARDLAATLCQQDPTLARFRSAADSADLRHVERVSAGAIANRAISAASWSSVALLILLGLLAVWIACDRDRFCLARGLCPKCLYELGAGITRCPECGTRPRQ